MYSWSSTLIEWDVWTFTSSVERQKAGCGIPREELSVVSEVGLSLVVNGCRYIVFLVTSLTMVDMSTFYLRLRCMVGS